VTVHRDKFPYNKNQLDALISQIYFGMKLYMFRTEELSETCRVSVQNKFEKLVHLVVFIIRKVVTRVIALREDRDFKPLEV
jgi:hypothetical protein